MPINEDPPSSNGSLKSVGWSLVSTYWIKNFIFCIHLVSELLCFPNLPSLLTGVYTLKCVSSLLYISDNAIATFIVWQWFRTSKLFQVPHRKCTNGYNTNAQRITIMHSRCVSGSKLSTRTEGWNSFEAASSKQSTPSARYFGKSYFRS